MSRRIPLVLALAAVSCGSARPAPEHATPPPPLSSAYLPKVVKSGRAEPPPSGITPDAPFGPIAHRSLKNGLELRVVERHALPIVAVALVVASGSASDGDKPGLAAVAAQLSKAGGAGRFTSKQLVEEAESLGARLDIATTRDSTTVSMDVASNDLGHALELVGAVALRPRFDPNEFKKLKQREIERVSSLSRTSGSWGASMVLYRELYDLPSGVHPYSHYDATGADLVRLALGDCKAWHTAHFVPKNAMLVIAGDVSADDVVTLAEPAFSGFKGERAEPPALPTPLPQTHGAVWLVDRPKSAQSNVYLATLGPERRSDEWPALRGVVQVLGGGVSGRLFLDVREKRSLAYATGAVAEEPAHGPVPVVLSAGTETRKTPHALASLLEHFDAIKKSQPTDEEIETASRYLSDSFLINSATVGAISNLTARLAVLGLPDEWYDDYRKKVRELDAAAVHAIAQRYFKNERAVIVVAGDAAALAEPLRRFGQVFVVDAEQGFVTRTKLEYDPTIALPP